MVAELRQALNTHRTGMETGRIADLLQELTTLYPRHIQTEDKDFFHQCMKLFSREEMDSMLEQFYTFDRNLVHEQFESLVQKYESKAKP